MGDQNLFSCGRLVLVRHGERLDQKEKDQWSRMLAAELRAAQAGTRPRRKDDSIRKDPPLTSNGIVMAGKVGVLLSENLHSISLHGECGRVAAPREGQSATLLHVYTSKLRRAVQTAHEIVCTLHRHGVANVCIVACTGLAEACAPVRKSKGVFICCHVTARVFVVISHHRSDLSFLHRRV